MKLFVLFACCIALSFGYSELIDQFGSDGYYFSSQTDASGFYQPTSNAVILDNGDVNYYYDDESTITIPFNFTLYGVNTGNQVTVTPYYIYGEISDDTDVGESEVFNQVVCYSEAQYATSNSIISYEFVGEAPNRMVVFTWENMGDYTVYYQENGYCNDYYYYYYYDCVDDGFRATYQIIIHENSNVEIYIQSMTGSSVDGGYAELYVLTQLYEYNYETGYDYDNEYYNAPVVDNYQYANLNNFGIEFANQPVSQCGNGIVESGEQCDSTSCCTATCTFASSSVVCRSSAGICDIAEMCTGNDGSCPADSFLSSSTPCNESYGVCDARLHRMCPGDSAQCSGMPIPQLDGATIQWTGYNVISFGGLYADSGNIGGRTAIRNSASFTGGFSVGSEVLLTTVNTPPPFLTRDLTFSLVVGGDLNWNNGELYPDAIRPEFGLVTGQLSVSDSLSNRFESNTTVADTLQADFDNSQSYYGSIQDNLASQTENAQFTNQWDGIFLTCNDANADQYTVSIDSNSITQSTWWSVDASCQYGSSWIINIVGNGDVMFNGGSFPGIGEKVVYNIIGSGRLITVSTGVNGNILAPYNSFVQTGGVTSGLIIVSDIQYISSAENPNCQDFQPFDIIVATANGQKRSSSRSTSGSDEIEVASFSQIVVGDVCTIQGMSQNFTVVERIEDNGKDYIKVQPTPTSTIPAGSFVTCFVSNPYANRTQDTITIIDSASSGSSLIISAIILLIALMF